MRKRASKFLSLFLVLAMVCSLFGDREAAEGTTQADGDVVVLYTNDVHHLPLTTMWARATRTA